jgi:hypothetical protein
VKIKKAFIFSLQQTVRSTILNVVKVLTEILKIKLPLKNNISPVQHQVQFQYAD